ncbi:hypothetical protein EV652_108403 [Kribbella steppae]|uniref:DUF8175 domain-containing protein n=1 Tax=Kribbella steppae TaxID=2512223 RepID=A0A4R2HBF6_9ACTN|nr:hypothetical protein [Kribbella steppae]TCO24867.1 hypothetical protein EV652_108403 [Kribbella steppae]
MNENEDQSPFGRGFIAACIVIGAVLLCGALLLITGLTSGSADTSAGTAQVAQAREPAQTTSTAQPAIPAVESGAGRSSCALPAGDQTIPTEPPSVDGWDVSRRVVVPRSTTNGPATTDPDGFRHCFAHSPSGAVFAAYNVVAALADQRQAIPTVRKLMLPGPNTDALIRELRKEEPSTRSAVIQLAGYRVLDADQDRATIMLALPVESAYMSITLTLAWHHDDWHLQPPPPGEPVGTPFAQHRDLNDFVAWSGV